MNPRDCFDLLKGMPIDSLVPDNRFEHNLDFHGENYNVYISYSDDESEELTFVFIYNVFEGDKLLDVEIASYTVTNQYVIEDDLRNKFDITLYSTEEELFQLSTISDVCTTVEELADVKKIIDTVYNKIYNTFHIEKQLKG
ncbi:hypothetical protein VWH97_05400 [Escherichia coli O157]|nr:hypothetical protein [Escherichia coli O157]